MNPSSNNNSGGGGGGGGDGAGDNANNDNDSGAGNQGTVPEQFLPRASVVRIMRKVLPSYAKISDDAKEATQECVSEFISLITSEASERCRREQRTTITSQDVLRALNKLGFNDYVGPLSVFLQRYRDHKAELRSEPVQPKRAAVASEGGGEHSSAVGDYELPPLPAEYQFPTTEPDYFQQETQHFGVNETAATGGGMGGYYMGLLSDPETVSSQEVLDTFDPDSFFE